MLVMCTANNSVVYNIKSLQLSNVQPQHGLR